MHAQCVTELQRFDYSGAIVTYSEGQDQRTPWLRGLVGAINRPGVQVYLLRPKLPTGKTTP